MAWETHRGGSLNHLSTILDSIHPKDTDDYITLNDISRKLNKVLRHQTGKATVERRSGRQHDILPCNEGGWVNIRDVLMYGHIFGDNSNQVTRGAIQGNYLEDPFGEIPTMLSSNVVLKENAKPSQVPDCSSSRVVK